MWTFVLSTFSLIFWYHADILLLHNTIFVFQNFKKFLIEIKMLLRQQIDFSITLLALDCFK